MKVLVLNHREVEQFLPMFECISAMEEAIAALARGETHQPLRTIFRPPEIKGVLAMMPTFRASPSPLFGLKAICVFPGNAAIGKDAHQGGVMLFDGTNGELLALMNASAITALRTAAVSAVATRLLAREDAGELTIVGSGVQARAHVEAMACVRSIRSARIVSKNPSHAHQLADDLRARFPFVIEPVDNVEEALKGADLVVTATTAREPVVKRQWLSPGVHINAIGTYSPDSREIDGDTMAAARVFVDRRESAFREAGDYLLAVKEELIGPDRIMAEIGEVLIGAREGRSTPDEITLFKSLGLAIEDLACAEHLFRKAQEKREGTWV